MMFHHITITMQMKCCWATGRRANYYQCLLLILLNICFITTWRGTGFSSFGTQYPHKISYVTIYNKYYICIGTQRLAQYNNFFLAYPSSSMIAFIYLFTPHFMCGFFYTLGYFFSVEFAYCFMVLVKVHYMVCIQDGKM